MSRDSFYPFEGSMHRDTFTHPARTFKSIDVPNVLIRSYRSLVFRMRMDDARLHWVLTEFRLIVNKSIRIANESGIRSRTRLAQVAYRGLAQEHDVYKQYIPSAFEAALGALKAHRRRLRKGKRSSVPYIRRLFLKAENQSYWLDRATGRIKIPVRSGEHLEYSLSVAKWHRSFLKDEDWKPSPAKDASGFKDSGRGVQGEECRDRPRSPDALRRGRSLPPDESPPIVLASSRNPSAD